MDDSHLAEAGTTMACPEPRARRRQPQPFPEILLKTEGEKYLASLFLVPPISPQCLPLTKPSGHKSLKHTACRGQPPVIQSRSAEGQEIDLRVNPTKDCQIPWRNSCTSALRDRDKNVLAALLAKK